MKQQGEIRIYVACLAAYNAGYLHGKWIEANQDPYEIWNEVSAMLRQSPLSDAEEWAIHDYEGFEGATIQEYSGFEEVSNIAAFITEHDALGGELIGYYSDLDAAQAAIEDHYAGEYESLSDFARDVTELSCETLPNNLAFYIDYERMGKDMEICEVVALETGHGQVHIFWQH